MRILNQPETYLVYKELTRKLLIDSAFAFWFNLFQPFILKKYKNADYNS